MINAFRCRRCFSPSVVGLFALSLLPAALLGQEVQWSKKKPYHDAVVKVWQKGEETGSGVLISKNKAGTLGYILTALSVVSNDEYAGVEWKSGAKSAGKVIETSESSGLALMTCIPPKDAVVAEVATALPLNGEACDHVGHSRSYYGQYVNTDDFTYTSAAATPGDIGGGLWYKNKLIGVIHGGRYNIRDGEEKGYPLRSTSLTAMKDMFTQVSKKPAGEVLAAQNSVPPNYFEFLNVNVMVEESEAAPPQKPESIVVPPAPASPKLEPPVPSAPRTPASALYPPAKPTQQIVSIDTELIARSVVDRILKQDMMPPQKVDDAEFLIRLADRLVNDPEFVRLVSNKIIDRVEQRVLTRVGNAILKESK